MLREIELVTKELIETQVGTIAYYYGTTDPAGALICDGRTIKWEDYPLLVEHLNMIEQTGNPKRDIAIPDCRGYFLRGIGGSSKGMNVKQSQSVGPHKHNLRMGSGNGHGRAWIAREAVRPDYGSGPNGTFTSVPGEAGYEYIRADGWNMDVETRPNNIAYNIIIYTGVILNKKNLKFFLVNFLCKILTSTREGGEINVCLDYRKVLEEKYWRQD